MPSQTANAPRCTATPRWLLMSAALAVAAKLAVLWRFGPIHFPDSAGYVDYARLILAGPAWLDDAGLDSGPTPLLVFRMAGYPLVLAAAMRLAGEHYDWLLAAVQSLATVAAGALLARLVWRLTGRRGWALWAGGMYVFGLPLLYDGSLLPDPLYAALVVAAFVWLSEVAAGLRGGWLPFVASGAALGLALVLRDSHLYLVLLMLPLVLLAARRAAAGRALRVAVVLAPVTLVAVGYAAWNAHRAGAWVLSTGTQTALLLPLIKMSAWDPAIFGGDEPLDRAAQESIRTHHFREAGAINAWLFTHEGLRAPALAAVVKARFLRVLVTRPLDAARYVASQLDGSWLTATLNPLEPYWDLRRFAAGERGRSVSRLWRQARKGALGAAGWVALAGGALARLVSALLVLGFLLGVPWRVLGAILGRRPWADVDRLLGAWWVLHVGVVVLFSLVWFDLRYMMPGFGALIAGVALTWEGAAR